MMNVNTIGRPSRHRVSGADRNFVGSIAFDPAGLQTLDNVTVTDKGGVATQAGVVRIDRAGGGRIVARTPDGCSWMLAVHGNTAELLDPATQSRRVGADTLSLRYWALVTDDGRHLSAFRDAVVDLDRVFADPADPRRMRAQYDSGDAVHPSDAGMRAIAEAIDLEEL